MPTSSIHPWSVWPTSKFLGRSATGGFRQLARYIKVPSSSTQKSQNKSVPLNSSTAARNVRQPPTLKGGASDVASRYVLNIEAFGWTLGYPSIGSNI